MDDKDEAEVGCDIDTGESDTSEAVHYHFCTLCMDMWGHANDGCEATAGQMWPHMIQATCPECEGRE
jgi:hypothetical protein